MSNDIAEKTVQWCMKEVARQVEQRLREMGMTEGIAAKIAAVDRENNDLSRKLDAMERREEELERIANEHGIHPRRMPAGWVVIALNWYSTDLFFRPTVYPTRRACDDAITEAVRAYEQRKEVE